MHNPTEKFTIPYLLSISHDLRPVVALLFPVPLLVLVALLLPAELPGDPLALGLRLRLHDLLALNAATDGGDLLAGAVKRILD